MLQVTKLGFFGQFSRYSLERWESRRSLLASAVEYAVLDAETPDPVTGCPSVVRQRGTIDEAVAGLASKEDRSRLAQ